LLIPGFRILPLKSNFATEPLGAHYFDEQRRQFIVDRIIRRIEHLGYRVHLEPVAMPAV
jgi:hypothetical protein